MSFTPLPHLEVQTEGEANVQDYPIAGPEHPVKHPTPLSDASSHPSGGFIKIPSPQTVVHVEGVPVQL